MFVVFLWTLVSAAMWRPATPLVAQHVNSNFSALPCIRDTPDRVSTVEKLLSLLAPTRNYPRVPLKDTDEFTGGIILSDELYSVSMKGLGSYYGVVDVNEYLNLARPGLNGNRLEILWREIIGIDCITTDTVATHFREDFISKELKTPTTQELSYNVTFAPNSSLIINFTAAFSPLLVDQIINDIYSAKKICDIAAQICIGELYPYESLEECYQIMSSMPMSCEPRCYDCYEKNAPLQGDTRSCRALHLTSAQLRPSVHCPHLANVSEKCFAEECPAAQRISFDQVEQELQPFDPRFARWMEILEVVVASIVCIVPLIAFIFYRWARSKEFKCLSNQETAGDHSEESHKASNETTLNANSEASIKLYPSMKCAFIMSSRQPNGITEDSIVISADGIDFGGCKLTAIVGPSGSGKSSLMKLLCGITQPHMELRFQMQSANVCDVAYTPQSSDIWPGGMKVRDIFFFACTVQGCRAGDFEEGIRRLQLHTILNQPFGSLSGGQQQRVHVLACMMRPRPTLMFLDEPLSALDEENAVAFLKLFTQLDVKHAFCVSIHQLTSATSKFFDRVVELNVQEKKLRKIHWNDDSMGASERVAEADAHLGSNEVLFTDHESGAKKTVASFQASDYAVAIRSLKAAYILWFGQFYGLPVIEITVALSSTLIMVLIGVMSGQALEDDDQDYVPSSLSTRIPFMILNLVSTLVIIPVFGASLVFAGSEKALLNHVIQQGDMLSSAVVGANLLRFSFYGIAVSFLMVITFLSIADLTGDGTGMVVINCAFFATASTTFCYTVAISVASHLAPQAILLVVLPMTFFNGVFFLWDSLSSFFQVLHYFNPLFYCLHACSQLVLSSFRAHCDKTASPYLECAENSSILELTAIQEISCLYTQLASAILLVLALISLGRHLHRRESKRPLEKMHEDGLAAHESVAFTDGLGSLHQLGNERRSTLDLHQTPSRRRFSSLSFHTRRSSDTGPPTWTDCCKSNQSFAAT